MTAQIIQSPSLDKPDKQHAIFLAGGITGCPDWQSVLIPLISHLDITIYNPRRDHFDVKDFSVAETQIAWEYERLHCVDAVSFWFAKETIQPIVLFELGGALERPITVFVGVHDAYPREFDVKKQIELSARLIKLPVVSSIDRLAEQITWSGLFVSTRMS